MKRKTYQCPNCGTEREDNTPCPHCNDNADRLAPVEFNEADCSGVFDGFGVVSDADPGL